MHPLRNQHLTDAKIEASNWKPVSRDVFDKLWQAEYDEHVNQIDEELIYLATGLLLPIWNDLPESISSMSPESRQKTAPRCSAGSSTPPK